MEDIDPPAWLDKLEATVSIKRFLDYVQEVSQKYEDRIAELCTEHRNSLNATNELHQSNMQVLQAELRALQQGYQKISVEYSTTQACLNTAKQELALLSEVLKKEEKLLALQLKTELGIAKVMEDNVIIAHRETLIEEQPKKRHLSKTMEILKFLWYWQPAPKGSR